MEGRTDPRHQEGGTQACNQGPFVDRRFRRLPFLMETCPMFRRVVIGGALIAALGLSAGLHAQSGRKAAARAAVKRYAARLPHRKLPAGPAAASIRRGTTVG